MAFHDSIFRKVILLGNIKQTHIKNTALELIERYPKQFSADNFDKNKEKVEEFIEVDSKMMRNKIAGYITRYLVSKQKGQSNRLISE